MARILLIDDEDQVRATLKEIMEKKGYEVAEAADGSEGMKLYREKHADLVVTDMIMPNKEGMETIMELRAEFPEAKIIAISGGGWVSPEPYLEVAQGIGAIRAFTKPFDIEEFLAAIEEVLQ